MNLFRQCLIVLISALILYAGLVFTASDADADTTSFRSANIITTDGANPFTNLENCSAADGQTCDRISASSFGNLYFRDFGNLNDFGIPQGSKITKVRIRVTGKVSTAIYVGLSNGVNFKSNCQTPSDIWRLIQLIGSEIKTQEFIAEVSETFKPKTVKANCFGNFAFDNKLIILRINYSSSQNWSANIDNFEIAFDYDLPVVPTPASAKTPLIIIPGIGGSELKTTNMEIWNHDNGHGGTFSHVYPENEKVWVDNLKAGLPGDDDYFDILKMDTDGSTSLANLTLTGSLFEGYQSTIDFFVANGYELDKNLFIFPYDWRKDVALTAPLLDQKIDSIKTAAGSEKVDIVAHSMGGLVARNYIADAGRASKVRKLFTLGTPHLGSVKFLKALRYGDCLTPLRIPTGSICVGIIDSETKDVLQNMISGYELAPTQKYFDFYSGESALYPFPFRDDRDIDNNRITGPLDYSQIKTLLTNLDHNTGLFGPSETFHNLDNNLTNTNGVEIINIVGSGIPTLGQIIERYSTDFLGRKVPHKDEISVNGDKTVPLFSASLIDPVRGKSLSDAKVFYTRQNHGDLVSSGPSLNLVKNLLENNDQLPSGVSVKAYPFKGRRLSVHSPINIHVYDLVGNHTGPTEDGFEENIPESSYETLDDAKFVFLPDEGQYSVKFEATDNGSFDFKIREFENDTISKETVYEDIPLTNATTAGMQFDTSSEPSTINLDRDNNGTIEQYVAASAILTGDAVYDEVAPITNINLLGIKGDNGWYRSDVKVTLEAADQASSSGVNRIEYSLDNGQTVNIYTEPFIISEEKINRIKFRSIDNAGNKENPKEEEIKIDKTAPEAKIFVDANIPNIIVTGIDENKVNLEMKNYVYTIWDIAGNSLVLDIKEVNRNRKNSFRIYSLKYNQDSPIFPSDNQFKVDYKKDGDELDIDSQYFRMEKEIDVRIQYDNKKNKSNIVVREKGKKELKENVDGFVLLELIIDRGKLRTNY